METITVEVAGKYGPKANGVWYGVKRPLKATDFTAGQSYEIETEDWNSNGKSGVNITSIFPLEQAKAQAPARTVKAAAKATVLLDVPTTTTNSAGVILSYEEQKNRRILRQGVVQAVIQSPMLAGLPFTNANDAVALVKDVANQLIDFVQE